MLNVLGVRKTLFSWVFSGILIICLHMVSSLPSLWRIFSSLHSCNEVTASQELIGGKVLPIY
jgi:hypothetical protein